VKKPEVEILGWRGYILSEVVRPVGSNDKFSQATLEVACGNLMFISLSGNSSGGHSCSQHANCTLPQLETSVTFFCGAKLHILEAFGPPHKVHLCNDHVLISLICHTYQADGLSWQRRNAH
jgi:hypothetical protein